jgi:hypothetical protein
MFVSWREPWNVGMSDRVVGGRTGAGRLVEWDEKAGAVCKLCRSEG